MAKNDLSADLAIVNANIKTMNPNQPTAQALAIAGNRIIKVGTNQANRSLNWRKNKGR